MGGNSFGKVFKVTSFGESHGPFIGVTIDGCPAGLKIDEEFLKIKLQQRRPGQSELTSSRDESELFQIISGLYDGISTGTPITILIPNEDNKSNDYDHLKNVYRPSHADYTYEGKYGIRDHKGGGRSSARETAARVAAGSIAQMILKLNEINVYSYTQRIGYVHLTKDYNQLDLTQIYNNKVRCPEVDVVQRMEDFIREIKEQGDTVGGVIETVVTGVPVGLGEPVFDKLHADLGKAILSINACKGFEIGSGFESANMVGSVHNDVFIHDNGVVKTLTNHSGGVQGGISNGMDIVFRAAFKPVSTIQKTQNTINSQNEETSLLIGGRHDPCVIPRAVPIVEAMTALVLCDHLLRNRLCKI
ncbi:MAG: chorismate synthase [Saprospiraceae bacterium]|nr:chorismate synthase [Saprospiraceae bacterium]